MTFYLKDGDLLWPTPENALDIREQLPVGTYAVGFNPMKGFYLRPITDFNIEGKIYGKTPRHAQRILNTFMDRPNTTGVLLSGEKGSGKTMLAKLISQNAGQQGISTLVINSPYHGDVFNTFIQSIDEPCIIVFDEFEKVFDEKQQEAILTLLDGVFPTKKLFVLTVNDKWKVNQQIRNRPGRVFYMIEYRGLDVEFIEEYCNDNLRNKSHITQVCRLTLLFDSFNFDMLKALVEEMNRYDETPKQAMEMLNAKPYDAGRTKHYIEVAYKGKKIQTGQIYPSAINGNPIAQEEIEIQLELPTGVKDSDGDDEIESVYLTVTPQDLKKIDMENGQFTYVVKEGTPEMAVLVFTREAYKAPAYGSYLDLLS
jgi:hypothetical protein